MAEFKLLEKGKEYILTVISINDRPSSFPNKKNLGEMVYCHGCDLSDDDGNIFKSQFCDGNATNSYGINVRDVIKVKVTSYFPPTKMYTVELIMRDKDFAKQPVTESKSSTAQQQFVHTGNPIMANTAAAVALKCAVEYFSVREEDIATDHTVESTFERYYQLLVSKHTQAV